MKKYLCFPSSLAGRGCPLMSTDRQVCPPKSSNLVQQPQVPDGRVTLENLSPASSISSMSSCASSASESSSTLLRNLLQRRKPIIPNTVKLPPGVFSQSAAFSAAPTSVSGNQSLKFWGRRRDHSGRRKDSTQSLYIENRDCDLLLHFSSCPTSASSSSSSISMVTPPPEHQHHDTLAVKSPRRFSDPDIPYLDEDV